MFQTLKRGATFSRVISSVMGTRGGEGSPIAETQGILSEST